MEFWTPRLKSAKRPPMAALGRALLVVLGVALANQPVAEAARGRRDSTKRKLAAAPRTSKLSGRKKQGTSSVLRESLPESLPESMKIQVVWTMVRSRVTSFGATSRNENYRETWYLGRKRDRAGGGTAAESPEAENLELNGVEPGALILSSARGKVVVHLATPDQSVVTTEGGLATLLGLMPESSSGSKNRGNQVAAALARPVSIQLREPRSPVEAQFSFGGEESFAVHFEIQSLKPESSN